MRELINYYNVFAKEPDVSKNPICRWYVSGRTVVTAWTWHMERCLRWRVGNRRPTTTMSMIMMITMKLENTPTFRAHISYTLFIIFSQYSYMIVFVFICCNYVLKYGARGDAVGCGTALQAGRSRVWFPVLSLEIFHWRNPFGLTMALGSTPPVTEISTRTISWGIKAPGA